MAKPKKPKKLKIKQSQTNTGIKVHDLSVKTPATHQPETKVLSVTEQTNVVDFVMGFAFPKDVFTTGGKEHNDFDKSFKKK